MFNSSPMSSSFLIHFTKRRPAEGTKPKQFLFVSLYQLTNIGKLGTFQTVACTY